jgi:hypothetical protein
VSNWWETAPVIAQPEGEKPAGGDNWWEAAPQIAAPPKQEPRKSIVARAKDYVQEKAQGVANFVSGADRREFDYPELDTDALAPKPYMGMPQEEADKAARLGAVHLFGRRDAEKLDILSGVSPEVAKTAQVDKFGNAYVTINGQPQYLNRPGFSGADVSEAAGGALATLPEALIASRFFPGRGLPGRAGLSGGVAASGSIMQDLVAQRFGSNQPVDIGAATTAGVAGALFEGLTPGLQAMWRAVTRRPEFYSGGKLTEAGKQVLVRAGVDPEQITDDFARKFAAMARDAANPEDAARLAGSQSLPVSVPKTKGDVTGSPSQQMFESLAEKGAYGEMAENTMRNFRSGQQEAVRANVPAIQGRISGGAPQVLERGQAGAQAQTALTSMRGAEKAAVDAAYDAARGMPAGFNGPRAVQQLYNEIGQASPVAERLSFSPKAQTLLSDLQALTPGDDMGVPVRALFDWRRRVSSLANETTDATEKAALNGMKRQFDATMQKLAASDLMAGDKAAVDAWSKAIGARSMFGKKWQAGDIVERLTSGDVTPEAASNLIFNSKEAGFINSPELVAAMRKLKGTLPTEQWNAIREEAFLRLAQQGEGAYSGSARSFSGVNFKKAWDNFQMKNAPLVREFFGDEERKLISQFAKEAAEATGKVRGGDNFSNTTVALSNLVQRLRMLPFGEKMAAFISGVPGAGQVYGGAMTMKTIGATNAKVPLRQAPVAGVLGATVGQDPLDYMLSP